MSVTLQPVEEIKEYDWTGCMCWICLPPPPAFTPGAPPESVNITQPQPPVWNNPTPWAILCRRHGRVFLSSHEYRRQLAAADSKWLCPMCHGETYAEWDDDNLEHAQQLQGEAEDAL